MLEGVATVVFGVVFYVSSTPYPPFACLAPMPLLPPRQDVSAWRMSQGFGRNCTLRGMVHRSLEYHELRSSALLLARGGRIS